MELDGVRNAIKSKEEQIAREDERRFLMRKQAAAQNLMGEREEDRQARSFRSQLVLTEMRGRQAMQRALLSASSKGAKKEKDSMLEQLEKAFARYMRMAGERSRALEFDKAKVALQAAEEVVTEIGKRAQQLSAEQKAGVSP